MVDHAGSAFQASVQASWVTVYPRQPAVRALSSLGLRSDRMRLAALGRMGRNEAQASAPLESELVNAPLMTDDTMK